ncbi:MAG: tRNA preQ1(34) S-adenosylmethionine ribosyltransferase-isomerase QueA [Planctomycetales bacterium]|nr:tRNA preQ1(34) S-adenosylmethionine ribosyltransferase-isomerase QueA [Planctomycetales bacterium]
MEPWIDYSLPEELVAQEPLRNRIDARLMVIDRARQAISHHHIRDLPRLLIAGDRLVLNDTRVIPAQLRGQRTATGGRWQGLYLGQIGEGDWQLVCKTRGRLKPMEQITLIDREGKPVTRLWLLERLADGQWLGRPESDLPTRELLDQIGRVPLPPYIRGGNMVDSDVEDYQTVFAKNPGAVAAPTAGLHFTEKLLRAIKQSGIDISAVTLHVGLGTFQPIAVDDPGEHPMHSEWGQLTSSTAQELNETRAAGGRNIAVGTTVTRVLESAAAAKAASQPIIAPLAAWEGNTELFIRPPYEFRAIDGLLTNFHFPRTTLLLLVQAFGGSELVRQAYDEAIREEYRFYSYGDAMLIL